MRPWAPKSALRDCVLLNDMIQANNLRYISKDFPNATAYPPRTTMATWRKTVETGMWTEWLRIITTIPWLDEATSPQTACHTAVANWYSLKGCPQPHHAQMIDLKGNQCHDTWYNGTRNNAFHNDEIRNVKRIKLSGAAMCLTVVPRWEMGERETETIFKNLKSVFLQTESEAHWKSGQIDTEQIHC